MLTRRACRICCIYSAAAVHEQTLSSYLQHQCLAQAGIENDVLARIEAIQKAVGKGASSLSIAQPSAIYLKTAAQVNASKANSSFGGGLDRLLGTL